MKIKLPAFKLGKKAAADKAEANKVQVSVPAKPKMDLNALKLQFQSLQGRPPGLWPVLPKGLLLLGILAAVIAVGYVAYWRGLIEGRRSELRGLRFFMAAGRDDFAKAPADSD